MFRPGIATALDPADATLTLAFGGGGTGPMLTIAGWVVVATVAGVVLTQRRSVSEHHDHALSALSITSRGRCVCRTPEVSCG